MSRRRRVVLSSAVLLLGVAVLLILSVGVASRSEYGQERVRRFLTAWLSARVNGTMYVGRVRGGFLDGVTVDSIEIRDDRGELFVASGPTKIHYDLRDLFDKRIVLRHLELTNPVVQVRQYADGSWNFRRIFPGGQPEPIGRRRGFGDFVIFDSASIGSGRAALILPWRAPAGTSPRVASRLLAEALADPSGHVQNTAHGPARLFRFDAINARLGRSLLAHPDTVGRVVNVLELSADSRDPPFAFTDVRGAVRHHADSVWFESPHWRLPGSDGTARGKITWGGGRPIRYAVRVESERASLADVAWVHPTFPREGGGRATLDIRNAAHDESVIEYVLTDLDVRSYGSHLTGRMIVDPGDPVLKVSDVSLRLAPLDFELLRVVNGKPFPYDWRGQFTGTVEASGGRVDQFRVERADLTFADAHVRGAVSRGVASGTVDILDPAFTVFHGLALDVSRLDLRTPRAVIREFPQLDGYLSGTATLDSLWLDLRFRDADIVHHDGDTPVSHVTGSGRVTLDEPYLTYDATLNARQLSFTTLAKSYPALPLRGEFSGPLRVLGQAPRLRVTADLAGRGGSLAFDGVVDAEAPAFGAEGSGTFARADLRELLQADVPRSALTGRYDVAIAAGDAGAPAGTFSVSLESSRLAEMPIESAHARGRIGRGVVQLDTVALVSSAAVLGGAGGIAFGPDTAATFRFTAAVDSLRTFASLFARSGGDSLPPVSGGVVATGELRTGGDNGLGVTADLTGTAVAYATRRAERLRGTFDVNRTSDGIAGDFSLAADTVEAGAIRLSYAQTGGSVVVGSDTSIVWVDSLVARINGEHAYRATAPATLRFAARSLALDSLVLAPERGRGSVAVRELLWSSDSLAGSIRSRDADLGLLSGLIPGVRQASGPVTVELDLGGTPAHPRSRGSLQLRGGVLATSSGRYEQVAADIVLQGTQLTLRDLSAVTPRGGDRHGTVSVTGTVDIADARDPVFEVEVEARSFRAVNRRGVALLDVSTGPALRLSGPASAAVLRGSLIVDEGTIFLPERLDKDITDLDDPDLLALVDTSAASRSFLPSAPGDFLANLQLDQVQVVIGEDVWLRSSEANVELGGSLLVTRTRPVDGEAPQVGLVGALNATRGTYVLNLGIVQPTFQVERGTLRFFGSPEVNPRLDIRAIHTVRQPRRSLAREDIRILASLAGTLRDPELSLSSADSLPLSQSDLLSYLVTGEPAFALTGTSTEYAEQLLTLGGRLAGTIISARIPRTLFDIVEVRTGAVRLGSGPGGASPSYLSTLYDTRVILGKQLSDRWYLGLSTGLCRANFAENLGLRLEYRLSSTYFAQGGIEPGSGDLSCVGPTTARAFQQTPPQLGADLFRSWRF